MAAYRSHNLPHLAGKNYETALSEFIRGLDSRDSAHFIPEIQEFIQSKVDPPLEVLWQYACFFGTCDNMCKSPPSARVSAIKDLLRLVISCSASCHPLKSIALASPIVSNLHGFIRDMEGFQLGEKEVRKIKREIDALIDSVLGYINVCCNGFEENFDCVDDLMPGWYGGKMESSVVFYPLLNEKILKRTSEEVDLIDRAALAIAEAFLLKLCWKIREEGFGEKKVAELGSWIIGSITSLKSAPFYEAVLYMLLEPVWPEPASLLNTEHEDGLCKILFDALLLVEYSFLTPDHLGKLPKKHAKRVILTRLVASHRAIELFRECGEHGKAISHINAFASSSLPGLLIKWVNGEVGSQLAANEPMGSLPSAYIKWMLNIENRGAKIFDDDMSDLKAAFNSSEEAEQLADGEVRQKPDSDIFYINNKGEQESRNVDDRVYDDDEMIQASMGAAFMRAARMLQSPETERRKRKTKDVNSAKQMKFVKYNAAISHSSLSRGSESDDSDIESNKIPSSDEDM